MKPSDITNEWVEQNFDVEKERKSNKSKQLISRITIIDFDLFMIDSEHRSFSEDQVMNFDFINKNLFEERVEWAKQDIERQKKCLQGIDDTTGISFKIDIDRGPCWDEWDMEIHAREIIYYKETYKEACARIRQRERQKIKKKQQEESKRERLLKEQERIEKELKKIEGEN